MGGGKSSSAMAALVVLLVVGVAVLPTPGGASWITVFDGPGCDGDSETYYFGCHDIRQRGGYNFVYADDETAFLFAHPHCVRHSGEGSCPTLVAKARNCSGVPFRSIYISKPPPMSCTRGD